MGLTQGDVRITIGVTGKGDTKVVKDAKKDVEGFGEKVGTAMKSSVAPVNKAREGFENLRANTMFMVGAAVSLGMGIAALAEEFSTGAQAIKTWEAAQKEVVGALEKTSDLVEEIQIKLGKRPPKTDLERLGENLRETWAKNQELIDKASGAIAGYEDRVETLTHLYGEFAPATQAAMLSLARAHNDLNGLVTEQNRALRENIDLINEIKLAAGRGFHEDVMKAGGKPFFEVFPAKGDTPRRSGGGGGGRGRVADVFDQAGFDKENQEKFAKWIEENTSSGGDVGAGKSDMGKAASGPSRMQLLAGDVRDFTAALSESLPGMDAFSGALSQISSMWGEYAETGKGAARATVMSVGAIAMAGAEQIKNERLRAGVLSIIHLGLGTALMFVPGAQQEALGHLAGAAILGSVAIFGGSGSGSGKRNEPTRATGRALSDRTSSGNVLIQFNGAYIARHTAQETAAELHQMARSGQSSGYVPAGG